jgi:cobalt-zinc-cadmium efflux system membrane fusion protein
MTMKTIVLLTSCLAAFACGPDTGTPAPGQSPEPARSDAATQAGPDEVRVDPGMLRDLRITTAAVESRSGGEDVTLLGELAVDERRYAEVGTPTAARVARLLAGPGDVVREGQRLLELDSPELGRLRSEYLSAQARATLAERALDRKRALAAERIAPEREVQEAEADSAAARAGLRSATTALAPFGGPPPADADVAASAFWVQSPVGGTVLERRVVLGQMLEPSMPAFRIADLSTLWLTVHAFERDAVRIVTGTSARVSFSALPGAAFTGAVTLVGHQVASDSRTIPVRIDVANRGGLLRPGMSGSAAVPVGRSDSPILTVPVAAVQRVGDSWCVFLPKDQGTFEIRRIGRGRDLGPEVELLSGVRAGETIVVDGAFLLKSQAEKRDAGHDDH